MTTSYKPTEYVVGRDIENQEIQLAFENNRWVTNEVSESKSKDNIFLSAVYVYIKDKKYFNGNFEDKVIE